MLEPVCNWLEHGGFAVTAEPFDNLPEITREMGLSGPNPKRKPVPPLQRIAEVGWRFHDVGEVRAVDVPSRKAFSVPGSTCPDQSPTLRHKP